MSNYITVSLSNGLYNAGILGLNRLLEFAGFKDFIIQEQDLHIHKDFFNQDLAALYIDFIYDQFKNESSFTSFLNTDYDNASNDTIKNINLLKNETPIKICEIYKDIRFIELKKEINSTKDIDIRKNLIRKLQEYLTCNKTLLKYLIVGDVTRSMFSMFLGSFGFLVNSQGNSLINTKKVNDVHITFEESLNLTIFNSLNDFIDNTQEYTKDEGIHCIQCGNYSNSKGKLIGLSFLNDFVNDPKRKNSAFWNYNVDAYACPLCAFVYSLMPFGFVGISKGKFIKDRLFINVNDSIEAIKKYNSSEDYISEQEINKLTVLNNIVAKELEKKFIELNYIEIILRENYEKRNIYSYEIIGKDILEIIKASKDNLDKIINKFVKVAKDDWLDLFKKVLNNILTFENQWLLLNQLIRLDTNSYILNNILSIQIKQNSIKEGYSTMDVDGKIKSAKLSGIELQDYFGDEAEGKLRSYIYRLVNALGSNNKDLFLDTVVRMYSGINKHIPNTFINLFANDDSFKEIGYAYLIGLKTKKKEEK